MQLSEMEMRILATLEEAGEEHACTVLNMIPVKRCRRRAWLIISRRCVISSPRA